MRATTLARPMQVARSDSMDGFITETQLDEVEVEFPGICALYLETKTKPRTFLELLGRYLARGDIAHPGGGTGVPPRKPDASR